MREGGGGGGDLSVEPLLYNPLHNAVNKHFWVTLQWFFPTLKIDALKRHMEALEMCVGAPGKNFWNPALL